MLLDTAPLEVPVHKALLAVMRDLDGIAKSGTNEHQHYKFRGIDQAMEALHDPLCNHGVLMLPKYSIICEEDRETVNASGEQKFSRFVSVEALYTFIGPMGDNLEVQFVGSASDSADKATNKAMAAALKYAILQSFMVPVGDGDADDKTDDAVSGAQNKRTYTRRPTSTNRTPGGDGITDPQKKAIEKIHETRELDIFSTSMARWHKKHDELTKQEASRWMDELNGKATAPDEDAH